MSEALPLTRRIWVSKAFYDELEERLEPDERVIVQEGEIGTGLVLWSSLDKRLIFYHQSPVKEPVR